jgi:hypothetical protein
VLSVLSGLEVSSPALSERLLGASSPTLAFRLLLGVSSDELSVRLLLGVSSDELSVRLLFGVPSDVLLVRLLLGVSRVSLSALLLFLFLTSLIVLPSHIICLF